MQNPEMYAYANSLQRKDVHMLLTKFNINLEWLENEQILDIGSGTGDVTSTVLMPLVPITSNVIGIDISADMVEYANKTYQTQRLSFKKVDMKQSNIGNVLALGSFHKVFSFYCLQWISDHRQALENIFALMKPSGDIVLMFLTPDNPVNLLFENLKKLEKYNHYWKDIKWFYESENPVTFFSHMLFENVFDSIICLKSRNRHRFPSLQAVMDYVKAINPYLSHTPPELVPGCLGDIEEMIKKGSYFTYDKKNDDYVMEYDVIVSLAKKPCICVISF